MRARRPGSSTAAITEPYIGTTGMYVHFVTNGSMMSAEVEPMTVCPQCGGQFEQRQYGRRAVWCSDACRVAAFRQRRAAEQAINAERNEQVEAEAV